MGKIAAVWNGETQSFSEIAPSRRDKSYFMTVYNSQL